MRVLQLRRLAVYNAFASLSEDEHVYFIPQSISMKHVGMVLYRSILSLAQS